MPHKPPTLLAVLPPEPIFAAVRTGQTRYPGLVPTKPDYQVSLRRMVCFAHKGTTCAHCGLVGTELRLEQYHDGSIHLDLYGFRDGEVILLTVDHVLATADGGPNCLANFQPLCLPCNTRKDSLKGKSRKRL